MMLIGVIRGDAEKGLAYVVADLLDPLRTGAGWVLAFAVVPCEGAMVDGQFPSTRRNG